MARSHLSSFSVFFLTFFVLTLTAAQPWRHKSIRRAHTHPIQHEAEPRDASASLYFPLPERPSSDTLLLTEYEAKLKLRDAISNLNEDEDDALSLAIDLGRDFTAHSPRRRQKNNEQLAEKLKLLSAALQDLMALLSQDYGVSVPAGGDAGTAGSFTTMEAASTTDTPPASLTVDLSPALMTDDPLPTSSTVDVSPVLMTAQTSASTSATATPTQSPGAFNPMSKSNTAVYYSQTGQTNNVALPELCTDPNIDIIILAFLNTFFDGPDHTGWPGLNMGPHCWAASAEQVAAGATGLIDCVGDGFAAQVAACQAAGKKVMLSVGGAAEYSDTTIPSDEKVWELAGTIWDLFLGGGTENGRYNETAQGIRPFGSVVFDGIDIDNESGVTQYMGTLMASLRTLFTSDSSKAYFLSAAPQCSRPDDSIPLSAMQTQVDFVWVQFYNNPACNLDSAGFHSSLAAWSNDLAGVQGIEIGGVEIQGFREIGNGIVGGPRVFVGAPAFAAAGTGYVDGALYRGIMEDVVEMNLTNLGGAMWWDGAYVEESAAVDGAGETYAQIAKDVLSRSGN